MPLFDFPGSNSKRARAWGVEREGDSSEGWISGVVVDVERVFGGEGRFEVDMVVYRLEKRPVVASQVCGISIGGLGAYTNWQQLSSFALKKVGTSLLLCFCDLLLAFDRLSSSIHSAMRKNSLEVTINPSVPSNLLSRQTLKDSRSWICKRG